MIDPRNYIPGCASYTKASEISSLQKYLKKGIKKRDEALELPENPEELKKDPLVPEVSELPKGAIGLHDPREVKELPDKSLKIVNPREEALVGHRENIKGAETPDLPETAVGLTDNREAALEDRRENIDVPETTSLVDHREDITDSKEVTGLPDTRLDINEALTPELPQEALKTPGKVVEPGSLETTKLETPDSETSNKITELPKGTIEGPKFQETPLETHREEIENNEDPDSLETHRENLEDKRGVSLENHKEAIEDRRKVALENHREDLEDKRRVALETHRENLEDERNPKLSDHKDTIEDKRNVSLEDHKESLKDKRNPSLETHREGLEDKRNPKLETHKDTIEDKRNVTLEDHKESLEDKRNPSLETHREDLEDKRSPKLETKKDIIEDKRNVSLDNTQLKAPGKQKTPELSGTVISGPEVKEVGLEKSKVTLEDKRGVTLETRKETLEDKRNPKLEIHREDLEDKRNPELPGTVIGLTDKRGVALENHKETLKDTRDPELPGTRENIKVTEIPDLPTSSVGLEVDSEATLEDHQEKLTGVQDISVLPEGSSDMPGEIGDPELDTTKITRPGADTEVVLPVDTDKLEGTPEMESLDNTRLDITDDRETTLPEDSLKIVDDKEIVLPDGSLPIEGEVPETTALEDTVIGRPAETPDIDQIYSDTSGRELYPLEGRDVTLPDTRLDITNPNEPFLEDERLDIKAPETPELVTIPKIQSEPEDNWTIEADKNPEGWDEGLVTTDDIKSEPEDNWTVEPDQNSKGWNEALVTTDDIKAEPEDNWTVEPDQNPEGWNEALVTVDDIISEPEDNWTVEPDKNPEGWNEALVTTSDIKAEPEDNWTIEPDKNEVGWNESLEDERLDITDVNEILDGLESIEPYASDTTRSQRGPSQTDDYVDIDQERRGNDTWPGDFSQDSAKAYGAKTETPEMMDSSQPNMATPNPWETGTDLNYINTRKESDLKQYGADTESPETRPDHKDPDLTADPNWKHIDTPGMSQGEFKDYSEGSTRDDLPKESNTGTYVSREDGSQLSQYGAKTAVADKMAPDKVAGDLGKAFNWSSENMGRSGWHLDDLAIPAYKLGGSFTSFLNPSKYLRFIVEKTVGVIPLKGSAKQWILDEALAGLIAARDKLEETLSLQPYRLPGSNEYAIQLLRQGMSGIDLGDVKNVVGNAAANLLSKEAVIIKNPINRPGKEDKGSNGKPYSWEGMERFEAKDGQNGSDIVKKSDDAKNKATNKAKKIAEKITKALGSNQGLAYYTPSYFTDTGADKLEGFKKNLGMFGTLSHLSDKTVPDITSFAKLKDALEKSPYVTTDKKLYGYRDGDVHRHDNLMTLDSNHVWEIILEPYLGVENGEVSYLPSIQQINYENFYGFGINTNWDTWIPFTSFELNSKKMVQKNLGLYSGEISIPQNLEFTNELRLVICDDQYKSWKRYFNYVMCASSYNCKVHDLQYYKKKKLKFFGTETSSFFASDLAYYHEGVIRPAPYKNLAFRCKIISMNPQYQAINVSDLLVVLKEFTEEWQGEVDASPTELAVTFSVVGENPKGEKTQERIMAAVQNWVKKITNPDVKTSPGSIFSF
jgi:hypothetical protein